MFNCTAFFYSKIVAQKAWFKFKSFYNHNSWAEPHNLSSFILNHTIVLTVIKNAENIMPAHQHIFSQQ